MDTDVSKKSIIPRIIHYCWLSGEQWDKKTLGCYNSWKKILPDWEYKYWTMDTLPREVLNIPTVLWAIKNKKWAFAADYIRIWALNKFGGLYMDLDVELLKSPLDLFKSELIVGYEKEQIGAHFIASVPNHPFIKSVEKKLRFKSKQEPLPAFITPIFLEERVKHPDRFIDPYPESFFNPFYWDNKSCEGSLYVTNDTYCIHWYAGGWIPKYKKTFLYKSFSSIAMKIGLLPLLRRIRGF